jgi:hypothetical protein
MKFTAVQLFVEMIGEWGDDSESEEEANEEITIFDTDWYGRDFLIECRYQRLLQEKAQMRRVILTRRAPCKWNDNY